MFAENARTHKNSFLFPRSERIHLVQREAEGGDKVFEKIVEARHLARAQFPFDMDEDGCLFLGSVAICRERAAQQAEEFGHSLRREIFYLAVHGLSHLLGYDHMTEEDKAQMRAREERILAAMDATRED